MGGHFWRFFILLIFPILGFAVSEGLYAYRESILAAEFIGDVPLSVRSIRTGLSCRPLIETIVPCITFGQLTFIQNLSVVTIAVILIAISMIWLVAYLARDSRRRIIFSFRVGVWLVHLLTVILIALTTIILGGTVYFAASLFNEVAIFGWIVALCVGGGAAIIGAIEQVFNAARDRPHEENAHPVSRSEQPGLWRLVDNIAEKLGASVPQNILCGLKPRFYVTAHDVHIENETFSGETMFISISLLRILSRREFESVVAHELSHFSAGDVQFTRLFAPAFARAVGVMENLEERQSLAALPSYILFGYFLERFALAQFSIARQREFEADQAGVLIAGAESLGSALAKTHALGHLCARRGLYP